MKAKMNEVKATIKVETKTEFCPANRYVEYSFVTPESDRLRVHEEIRRYFDRTLRTKLTHLHIESISPVSVC